VGRRPFRGKEIDRVTLSVGRAGVVGFARPDPGYARLVTTSQLVRPRDGTWIAGVCAGLADRFGLPRGLVRLVFVIFGLVGAGELAYIILWFLIPKA
jgi:phage shock protein PspC (stress-responsive transcriptional regulator)